jgi:hypothetical protein
MVEGDKELSNDTDSGGGRKMRRSATVAGPSFEAGSRSSVLSTWLLHLVPWTNGPSAAPEEGARDIVDEWGEQSFPASDPPANW